MVRKPNIVRGIPMPMVRAMPTIFYYGRFAGQRIPEQARSYFHIHIQYLIESINKMAATLADDKLEVASTQVEGLAKIQPAKIEDNVYHISRNLSAIFSAKKDELKKQYDVENGVKNSLIALFRSTAKRPKIAIVDTSNEFEWVDKLSNTLTNSCYYDIVKTNPFADGFTDALVDSDFVLFASATPQRIHEDVENLKTFNKPCLILGQLKKDKKLDQQTIRNGAWLRTRGYDVLFKLFSPLRLFTSIDKINIRYLLKN